MKDKIQKLIAEIIGDGFTVEVKPLSGGNVSSDFGAGVTTYLSVYTDGEGDQAIYVNGKLESHNTTIYGHDVVKVADGRLVRMRSAVLDESVGKWPENESELKDMIDGHQDGIDAGSAIGAPDRDGLVLRSEWNAKEGCFEDSIVEPEKEPDWEPKVDGWVRLPEGKVAKVKCVKIINGSVLYGFHGTNIKYSLGALKPWVPKVGDKVVINHLGKIVHGKKCVITEAANGKYVVQHLDVISKNLKAEHLEPVVESPADHIADGTKTANPSETPNSSTWIPRVGDKVRVVKTGRLATGKECVVIKAESGEYTVQHLDLESRNLEAKDLELIEATNDTQYREPTYADLANGPIEVEVCYDNTLETSWGKRMLYAVLPAHVVLRFVCEDPDLPESIYRWKHARVKVR